MKKALNLFFMYILILIAGMLIGTFFYTVYQNVLNYVAGSKIVIFNTRDLIKTMFYIAFYMLVIVCPLLSYYKVKVKGSVSQLIVYIVIAALTWAVLFPLTISLGQKYSFNRAYSTQSEPLSGGYFRGTGNRVYYFTRDFGTSPLTGEDTSTVVIDKSQNGIVSVEKIKDSPDFVLYSEAEPCRDILVKQVFEQNGKKIIDSRLFLERAVTAWNKGWTFWLGFISLGLALCSLFFVANFFEWKLMNTSIVFCFTGFILICNTVYFNPFFTNIRNKLFGGNGFFDACSKFVDDPLLVILNVIFSLLVILAGVLRVIAARKRK